MLTPIVIKALIILAIFVITLITAMYSTYGERKIAAFFQDRVGPNRAGPFGLLQPLADGGKMIFKEEFIPANANKWLFIAGPSLAMLTALMSSAVIPFGDVIAVGGNLIQLQGIEVNIGILYVFGVVSLGVYGIMVGGWASNNKYSLLGAIRAASQNISYELALGLSMIAILMMTGSLSLRQIVENQSGSVLNWNIFKQPIGFVIFLICAFAECNRTPFDLPECETELVGGYHTEYGSMKLGFYLFAEYINMFISSAIIATLYFGGFNVPWIDKLALSQNLETALGTIFLFGKIFFFIFFFMWVRWTIPRFRYDQLMNLGWKVLVPLSIFNIIFTGTGILMGCNWFSWIYFGIIVVFTLLYSTKSTKQIKVDFQDTGSVRGVRPMF